MEKNLKRILLAPVYLSAIIAIGLAAGYLTFKVLSFSRTIEMPELKTKTLLEANNILNKAGLYLRVEGEDYDPEIPAGLVARQDIPAGNKVKEGRLIKVIISKGPEILVIPDLAGKHISEADSILSTGGMRISRIIRVRSNSIEKDLVIAQRPAPDEAQDRQHKLSVVVSSGPYDKIYLLPDLAGKGRQEVVEITEKLGVRPEFAGTGKKVKSHKPAANSAVKPGDTVIFQMEGETASDD